MRAARTPDVARAEAGLLSTSTRRWLDERFDSEHVKAALGWDAISNTLAGPSTPGTALSLLHEHAAHSGGGVPWGFVPGGMGTVTGMMADAAREAGADLRPASPVDRIVVEDGRACGVVLESGEELRSRIVLSNADPKRTFLGLCDPADVPEEFARAIDAYRCDGASMKINLAVDRLPEIPGTTGLSEEHHGLIQLTLPLEGMDRDQESARQGVPAVDSHVELCIPTVHDPSLAPPGHHVITVGARSQPYALAEGTWDDIRESVADRIVQQIGGLLPNVPDSVVHRQVLSPLDLERRLGLTGGHHMHGDMLPDQLFWFRARCAATPTTARRSATCSCAEPGRIRAAVSRAPTGGTVQGSCCATCACGGWDSARHDRLRRRGMGRRGAAGADPRAVPAEPRAPGRRRGGADRPLAGARRAADAGRRLRRQPGDRRDR